MLLCEIPQCNQPKYKRQWCNKHYKRWQRHSDPLGGRMYSERHGKTKSREYATWLKMKQRCYNPNDQFYLYYGGRGVRICDRWKESFNNFLKDMGTKPTGKHTIDRTDVNGNYEPSNCRWATKSTQTFNQGIRKNNTSGVRGVIWDKTRQKWRAEIKYAGRRQYLGRYKTKEEAQTAYAEAYKKINTAILELC